MKIVILALFVCVLVVAQTPKIYFPKEFTSEMTCESLRTLDYKLYYSATKKKFRIDSYGVPLVRKNGVTFPSMMRQTSILIDPELAKKYQKPNAPLYEFIFRYDQGLLYSLFPSPTGWDCRLTKLLPFSATPIIADSKFITNATYVGELVVDGVDCDHFSSDFVMFGVDYMQTKNTSSGYPQAKRLLVGADLFTFKDINQTSPDDSMFELPKDTGKCSF